ncbi:MAG TPA: tetratricopeptide repeat protein, partial [Aestuariivirga sp.]
ASLTTGTVFAAGSATTPSAPPAAAPQATKAPMMTKCHEGFELKTLANGKHKCVKVKAELTPDQELYAKGYKLAKAGDYEQAIAVLSSVENHDNPDVLNMLGYSNRKAGRIELGISYYAEALALKPDFVLAREYLGEGYVAAGKVDLAKVQLAEIQKICGTNCAEFKDLSKVINGATL